MTFEVMDPGLLTTVQDLGRPGYGAYGVPEGGALDRHAHARANALLGNDPAAATLEFTLAGPRLRWGGRYPVRCAVVGDDESVRLVKPGTILDCGRLEDRARGYVAAPAGFYARPLLGSASTCLAGGFGGHLGRALQRGDRLDLVSQRRGAATAQPEVEPAARPPLRRPARLRVLPGPAGEAAMTALVGATWTVADGDRAGLRLRGPALPSGTLPRSMPLVPGGVEVTGGGQPLLLLREHPTVGGYPVIAVVIAADLDLAGQLRPGAELAFTAVTAAAARAAWPGGDD